MIKFSGLTNYSNIVLLEFRDYQSESALWDTTLLSVDNAYVYHNNSGSLMYDNPLEIINVSEPIAETIGDFLLLLELEGSVNTLVGLNNQNSLYRVINIGENISTIGPDCFSNDNHLVEVDLGYLIDTIDTNAFNNCNGLLKIYYSGNSLTTISSGAFSGCGFSTINIPDTVTLIATGAFSQCTNLYEVNIPDSVTTIATKAFSNCNSLKKVTIGSGTINIGEMAFYKCDNIDDIQIHLLNSVYFDGGINAILKRNYEGNFSAIVYGNGNTSLPTTTTSYNLGIIAKSAFQDCSNLINVNILGSNIYSLEDSAFSGCNRLTSFQFPTGIVNVGKECFKGCTSLVGNISNSTLTFSGTNQLTIKDKAFYGCISLNAIDFQIPIRNIGDNVFGNCSGINVFHTSQSYNTANSSYYITNNMICQNNNNGTYKIISGCVNSSLQLYSITSIGENAFYGCTRLSSLNISNTTIATIGENAFYGCTGLLSVNLTTNGRGLEIQKGAFYSCVNLSTLNLASTRTIRENAFSGCIGLTSIDIPQECDNISESAFNGCINLRTINVSSGNNTYTAANTSNQFNAIINSNNKKIILTTLNSSIINSNNTSDNSNYVSIIGNGSGTKMVYSDDYVSTTIKQYITKVEDNAFESAHLKSTLNILPNINGSGYTYTEAENLLTNNRYWQPSPILRWYGNDSGRQYGLLVYSSLEYDQIMYETQQLNPRISRYYNSNTNKLYIVEYVLDSLGTISETHNLCEYYWSQNGSGYDIHKKLLGTVNGHYTDNDGVSHWSELPTSEQSIISVYTYPNYIYVDTSVASNMFYNRQDLCGDLPANMYTRDSSSYNFGIEIGKQAFSGISELNTVNIQRPIINMGVGVFSGNTNLTTVRLGVVDSDNTIQTGFDEWFPAKTFMGCTSLTQLSTNSGYSDFTNIRFPWFAGESSFEKCNLTNNSFEVFGKKISYYDKKCFFDAFSEPISITFGSLSELGDNAFGNVDITQVSLVNGYIGMYQIIDNGLYSVQNARRLDLCARNTTYQSCHSVRKYAGYGRTLDNNLLFRNTLSTIEDYAFEGAILTTSDRLFHFSNSTGTTLSIGKNAFSKSNLLGIIIPYSSVNVGDSAFDSCTSLNNINVNQFSTVGNKVFNGCTGLNSATLKVNNIIGNYTFNGCTNMTTLVYNGTDNIGKGMTANCTSLISINCTTENNATASSSGTNGESLNGIFGTTYEEGVLLAGCKTTILPSHYRNTAYDSIVTLTTIGQNAFEGCLIDEVIMPNTIVDVDKEAFLNCTNLTNLYLSDNIQSIGDSAFKGCTSLEFVRIPNTCTTIGANAFSGCTSLQMVSLDNDSTNNIQYLSDSAFNGCTNLTSMIETENTSIPERCYQGCTNIGEIHINENIRTLGMYAFYGCTGAKTLKIDGSLSYIDDGAFYGCSNISDVYINAASNSINISKTAFNSFGANVDRRLKKVHSNLSNDDLVQMFVELGYTLVS